MPIIPQRASTPVTKTEPGTVTILVAEFEGPSPQSYRVTEKIIQRLRAATSTYSDISVQALGQSITVQQGSEVARDVGIKRGASIVLWGYYAATPEAGDINVYFEVLQKPKYLQLRQYPKEETVPISELDGFKIQTRLSKEMAYLTLATIGLARYEAEDYAGAIDRFTTAIAQSDVPDQMISPADIYLYRGNANYFKDGMNGIDKAIEDYSQAIKIKPDFPNAYVNRGIVCADKGEYDRAIADFSKAIEIKSDYADAYLGRGAAYGSKDKYDQAIINYDQAIKIKPDYAEAYYNRGTAYSNIGNYDRAIADYDQAVKLKPDYAEAYYNRGQEYGKLGQYDQAIADYDQAVKLKPDDAEAYSNRGAAYDEKGQYHQAITDYDQAIKIKPDYVKAYYNRGTAYGKLGQYDRAIADFDQAIKIKPDLDMPYYNRAFTYKLKGEPDLAIADFEHFLKITSNPEMRQIAQRKLLELRAK